VLGAPSDHFGRKRVLLASLTVATVGYLFACLALERRSLLLLAVSTRPLSTATFNGQGVSVQAKTAFRFADFGPSIPPVASVLSAEDAICLETDPCDGVAREHGTGEAALSAHSLRVKKSA
jgi:MFS family permease